MTNLQSFQFNAFQENTYLVWDQQKNCVVIDPGCYSRDEQMELISFIEENDLKIAALLNTHAHIDHILGNQFILNNIIPSFVNFIFPKIGKFFIATFFAI
jgi:glyoxylase-like metal-dependent hydrolase (beta-lactamase superfamily II)